MVGDGNATLAFVLAVGLAGVHLVADRVPDTRLISRNQWLSATAGVSIVYVFMALLPKLERERIRLGSVDDGTNSAMYILVFCGLTVFFGLERVARLTTNNRLVVGPRWITEQSVFVIHVAVFAVYNAVIGYVVVSGELVADPLPYALAMGLHLFGIDEGLRQHHREAYHRIGRWVLMGAIIAGAVGAVTFTIGVGTQTVLLALLAGGILFNAIKEELPADRESSFLAFIVGAGVFAGVSALLL